MSAEPPPIMVRAKITAAEWAALRKLAVDRGTTPPQLIADALRAAYPLTEGPKFAVLFLGCWLMALVASR